MSAPCMHPTESLARQGEQYLCTECGDVLDRDSGTALGRAAQLDDSGQLAVVDSSGALEQLLQRQAMPVIEWAKSLLDDNEFDDSEASPERDIVAAILAAETSEQAMAVTSMRSAEDLIGREPGGHSQLLRIHGATPLKSSFAEGAPVFCVIDCESVAEGDRFTLSCGGRAVQAVILAHVHRGWLPFTCILTRRLKPTRAGFYPLNLEAGG